MEPARRVGHLRKPAHQALVSEADYIAAQGVGAVRGPVSRTEVGAPGRRAYLLAGLLRCGMCGRRMGLRGNDVTGSGRQQPRP